MASAKRSWAWVESLRNRRPEMNSGASPRGRNTTTHPVKLGLTARSRITAPDRVRTQRNATGAPLEIIRSTMVMSVVMRESSSPVRTLITWARSSFSTWS